jgi:Tol biopolymer transport system component
VDPITSVSASTNGRRVVVTVAKPSAALWRVPLLLNGLAHESDVRPYPITGRALAPRFSEKSLLYLSSQGAPDALWQSEGGGREGAELWRGENVLLSEPVAVSRQDGRIALVAYDKQSGKRRLMITAADGSDPRTLTSLVDVKGAANQGLVDWSPDGKSIVAGGVNAKGVTGLFLVPLDGGDPKPLVEKTGTNPVSSPSEDLIVYASKFERGQVTLSGVRSDGTPVEIRHLTKDEKGERKLDDVRTRQGGYRFLPDGKLMFVTTASSPDFWVLDLITKEAKKVAELNDNRGRQITFDVSPDGKYIVFDRIPENSDIYMIEF